MDLKDSIASHAYVVLATISTFSLLAVSISLLPVAKWARIQNECIERTFRTESNNAGIPTKVWSCNGGGD
tara:strand:+ start:1059 stop:1268 length:210 start_codon:yes stop_codon:yes gene_type:complete